MRFAITRANRRLSPRMATRAAMSSHRISVRGRLLTDTACLMNSKSDSGSRTRRIAPASNREISNKSSTKPWNRATSLDSKSSAACDRSGSSSRRDSRTCTDAAKVIRGLRSSWLTSEVNRASRSTRSCSVVTMSLNAEVRACMSGSSVGSRRVSSRPSAIARAACAALASGRTARREANTPSAIPTNVVVNAASTRANRTLCKASRTSRKLSYSKYMALMRGRGIPTTSA